MKHNTPFLLIAAASAFILAADASAKPLNVVVLIADDLRHDTLGIAGNPVVKTPNLEQLFHLTADPFEENDPATDPAHAQLLAEMRARFSGLKTAAK